MPAGVLYVRLIEAEHVPNMDIFSKTDAFAKVFVRKRNQRKSRVIFNSLHPRRAATGSRPLQKQLSDFFGKV